MAIEASVTINASREAVWAVITDIDRAAERISGIVRIDVQERPAQGVVGLRWLETRSLRGDEATVELRIVEAEAPRFYRTRAEAQGFEFMTTISLSGQGAGCTLTSHHESRPLTFAARLMMVPMFLFKGMWRKLLEQDLADIKSAVEQR